MAEGKSYLDMSIDPNAFNPVINWQNQFPLPVYPQMTVTNKHHGHM
jgi:hypothetical protein